MKYTIICAPFATVDWPRNEAGYEAILKSCSQSDWCLPTPGIWVFRTGKAYAAIQSLASALRQSEVSFVQFDFNDPPISGLSKDQSQKLQEFFSAE